MKIFISQKMHGKTNEEIQKERDEATDYLKKKYPDAEIIDSFLMGIADSMTKIYWLGESIKKLAVADIAYFCRGWETARGCIIEHKICELYGIPYLEQ